MKDKKGKFFNVQFVPDSKPVKGKAKKEKVQPQDQQQTESNAEFTRELARQQMRQPALKARPLGITPKFRKLR